jgi:hypothetical protein
MTLCVMCVRACVASSVSDTSVLTASLKAFSCAACDPDDARRGRAARSAWCGHARKASGAHLLQLHARGPRRLVASSDGVNTRAGSRVSVGVHMRRGAHLAVIVRCVTECDGSVGIRPSCAAAARSHAAQARPHETSSPPWRCEPTARLHAFAATGESARGGTVRSSTHHRRALTARRGHVPRVGTDM